MTRILIVEDEPSYREILVFRLTRDGYDTLTAQTGEEALEKFAFGDTDLVLLDLMLPKISGMEVCRKIREKSDVPIIMLTAKGAEKDVISGLDTGAYGKRNLRVREQFFRNISQFIGCYK